jgi:integrase
MIADFMKTRQQSKPNSGNDQTYLGGKKLSATHKQALWRKVPKTVGLYEYVLSGTYFVHLRRGGRLHRESLKTKDLAFAKRKLRDFVMRIDRTDPRYGKISFVEWLERIYFPTLRGSGNTLADKWRTIERLKRSWLAARAQPMRDLKPTDVERWLSEQFGELSHSSYNGALSLVRDALAKAVTDRVLFENPAAHLRYLKRHKPIRLTPAWEEFKAIVVNVREQWCNSDAQATGDFLDFLGRAGVGQAEASAVKREHVDLAAGRILLFRAKTRSGYAIPIFPWLRPLVERLCEGKKQHEYLFTINSARKALTNACKRLGLSAYTQRSLRRTFITRAIELGVDIKTIAAWQNHGDGGKLILDTYSHVRQPHAQRMAQLLTEQTPENVIEMPGTAGA